MQLQKLWDRGDLLASVVMGETLFPRRLALKVPNSADMTLRFEEVRQWIAIWRAQAPYRIVVREFKHRLLGSNAIPDEAWLDSFDDAIKLLGKRRDLARFNTVLSATLQHQPILSSWLAKRPLRALELADDWQHLLNVVSWLHANPRPNIYLRQVDIAGVHSKFIEAHRGVLTELLDIALPPQAIDTTASGVNQFAKRYGFRDKPLRIRFRFLDPAHVLFPCPAEHDMSLDTASFAQLDVKIKRVFITENEINFLAFPLMPDSLIIFGAGYGFEALREATWLSHCKIYYWGDIDTHGFAILDQLRQQFHHVESFLMDRRTLMAFESQWGVDDKQSIRDLSRLAAQEQALYDELRDNRLRKNVRLEQERIGFAWVTAALSELA